MSLLRAVGRATEIFSYHFYTARDALSGILNVEDAHDIENLKLVFGVSSNQDAFDAANLTCEANLLACIHVTRNMFEHFAQLTNELVISPKLSVDQCSLSKVRDRLPCSHLKNRVAELSESKSFKYVDALNNTTKHRLLVNHGVTIVNHENQVGSTVGAFEYRGMSFPQRWVRDVLSDALEVKNSIIDCGNALNDECISNAKH